MRDYVPERVVELPYPTSFINCPHVGPLVALRVTSQQPDLAPTDVGLEYERVELVEKGNGGWGRCSQCGAIYVAPREKM